MRFPLLLACLLLLPLVGRAADTAGAGDELLLFFSSDVQGKTEPCG